MSSKRAAKVVIRADASTAMGVGHVMRCLALAGTLRDRGADVHFICREHDGHVSKRIEDDYHFPVHRLPRPASSIALCGYAAWLGVDWSVDAMEVRQTLADLEGPIDWMIVDHYALDARWEQLVRPLVGHILVVDDLFGNRHDCDLLLNQNLAPTAEARYHHLVPAACRLVMGPQYALLRPEFAMARQSVQPRTSFKRLLLFFGGADTTNETAKAIRAVQALARQDVEAVDVLVGSANPHREHIRQLCENSPLLTMRDHVKDVTPLYGGTDLVLGASGGSTWERACLGLPSLVVTIAENQEEVARSAEEAGILYHAGRSEGVTPDKLAEDLDRLLGAPHTLQAMSRRGMDLVDGRGCERVAHAMGFTA